MHPDIRYHLDSNVKSYGDKVFLHMQVTFGNVLLDQVSTKTENASPLQTQFTIFQSAPRITKAILLVAVEKKYGVAVRSALELLHTVNGKSWEDHANVFRQIPRLGPKSLAVLAANGITCEFSWYLEISSSAELIHQRSMTFASSRVAASRCGSTVTLRTASSSSSGPSRCRGSI
jgi:ATP-dependent DNA helicase HFM1/MER3